jgi:hypothetical protein
LRDSNFWQRRSELAAEAEPAEVTRLAVAEPRAAHSLLLLPLLANHAR